MGTPLSEFANVTLSAESSALSQEGFGIPLVPSCETSGWGTDMVRFYNGPADVAVDFAATSATYKQLARLFGQSPRPPTVAVGKRNHFPTQRFTLTPTLVANTPYRLRVGATAVNYSSDGETTLAQLCTALTGAINTAADTDTTIKLHAANNGGNTAVVLTGTSPGLWTALENLSEALISVVQDSTDAGLASDLDAIRAADDSWYAVFPNAFASAAEINAAANWSGAADKLILCNTCDTAVAGTSYVSGTSTDIGATQKDAHEAKVALAFHRANDAFPMEGVAGMCLPKQPGSETWHAKQIRGVALANLTPTQRVNLKNRNVSFYTSVAGRGIFFGGKVAGGEFIDIIRGTDWAVARMQERTFGLISSVDKVAYDQDGINQMAAECMAVLMDGGETGLFRQVPRPEVNAPLLKDVPDQDLASRTLNGITFSARYAGAIHLVNLTGTLSV